MQELKLLLPEKAKMLFKPARYKVLFGGRGSGKSHSCAKALLLRGASQKERILCAREVQRSIKDSVHRLLADQIQELGLGYFYQVFDTEIRGINGTQIFFTGLSSQTIDSVKSYEGVSVCWVEEAQVVSQRSWDILIPTIRKPESEIWITMNPSLDSDPTYKRFIETPPPNSLVAKMNYMDNPFFPEVLEQERFHYQATQPEANYRHVWLGECMPTVEGAIYAKEVAQAMDDGRVIAVPYNPKLKVHCVWDLGWADSMAIIMVQKVGPSAIAVIDYMEDNQRTLDWYVQELKEKRYNFGTDWIPHDGTHKDFKTGQSTEELLKRMGRKPEIIPNIAIESGIKMARMAFSRIYFDKDKTAGLMNCLKRYRRAINQQTGEPGAPVHDESSHGSDSFRYLGVIAEMLNNDSMYESTVPKNINIPQFDSVAGY